ncbi:MAG: secretin N-terminal domain-containing protein [bacterium]
MLWKNRSSVVPILILLTTVGLALASGSGLAQASSEKRPTLISLDVKQMDLQDVLRLIAEKANVNIIAGREVAGSITLRLKNVDLWQALKAVLEVSGFGYREENGIIRVGKLEELVKETPPLITEMIFLKYAKPEDVKKALQPLLSPSGTIEIDIQTNTLIIKDISENMEKIREMVTKLDTEPSPVLKKKRFQLNYINVEEKKDILTEVLGNLLREEGEFFLDPLTNSIYMEAPSSRIRKVEEYFEGADGPPKRIMIKAEFVEVQISAEEELGIRWRWMGAYEKYPLGATFRHEYVTRSDSGEAAHAKEPFTTLATGMGIIFGSTEQEFRGILDLLISEGKARLLSSPNIVTLEREEATIDVGDEHPYRVARLEEGAWVYDIKFITVGAKLVVTPHIKEEKRIVLDIQPEVNELTASPPFEGAPPVVGTRKARTQIAVTDGETIVIGGLLRETQKETRAGVPFLSRLPILGSLFSHKTIKKEKTDLLVFITPYILPEKLEEENIIEKRRSLKVEIEELYQKGLGHKKNEEYKKARECFEEVIKKSRIYGLSDYLKTAEKELANLKKLEEERLEKEKRGGEKKKESLEEIKNAKQEETQKARVENKNSQKKTICVVGLGEWFPSRDNNSFMVFEAQLRFKGNLRLFGGGGKSSDGSSYLSYLGARIGNELHVGIGGMNSTSLDKTESMLTLGFSLGTDRVKLEGNYFYIPQDQDFNGITAILGIRF